ncbi:MAG TPA: class D beta-lactamase [Tepidisphaeraceae bacterium]|nr:class D beta-lactamase [Tepidisphaeraceae bacterium]
MKWMLLAFLWPAAALGQAQPDLAKRFIDAGYPNSTMLVYDLRQDVYTTINPSRTDEMFLPASTFKIFNSMAGLETGVLQDENSVIKWDGVKRTPEIWNRDHTLQSAIQVSCVPYFQEVARRIGHDRMQHWIDAVGYGNQNIGGKIDEFWLDGDLRISARQQVQLLVRLYKNDLPFSQRTMDIEKKILINEQTPQYTLRAKTGWAQRISPQVGWWVGWVERSDGSAYFFAMNISTDKPPANFADVRIQLTRAVLKDLKILPADAPDK